MSQNFLNLCYNIAGKRDIKKKLREDARYTVLYSGSPSHGRRSRSPLDSDDDSSPRHENNKPTILNKIFKKAKNSDDEDESSDGVNETTDMIEIEEEQLPNRDEESSPVIMSVFNRKHKRYIDVSCNIGKSGSCKRPGRVKIRPAPAIPVKEAGSILEEFDPLWTGEAKNEVRTRRVHNYEEIDDIKTMPIKPPRIKINNKLLQEEEPAAIQENEVKVAKVDFIVEIATSATEQVVEQIPNIYDKSGNLLANANVGYENMEGALHTPVVRDNSKNVNEGEVRIINTPDGASRAVYFNKADTSDDQNLCALCKAPKKQNVAPIDVKVVKEETGAASIEQLDNEKNAENAKPKKGSEEMAPEEKQRLEDERKATQFIAQFFSEHARSLNDDDIANYSKNIKISKIEIYAEDVKRYYEGLKYRRGPVEHDTIYITVGTALDFVQKLVKEREAKKKYRFIPDMIEKCFKSKAKREAEAKKKEEEKKKKDNLRPKMWLVFNKVNKEKIIICTPGEFYDSD